MRSSPNLKGIIMLKNILKLSYFQVVCDLPHLKEDVANYHKYKDNLLFVTFTTLQQYLHLLESVGNPIFMINYYTLTFYEVFFRLVIYWSLGAQKQCSTWPQQFLISTFSRRKWFFLFCENITILFQHFIVKIG